MAAATRYQGILRPAPESQPLVDGASSGSDSAFLLLSSSSPSFPTAYALPRPRYLFLLVLACLVDLGYTLTYCQNLSEREPGKVTMFVWGVLRPTLVLVVACSRRVRELSWVVLTQVVITLLVALYRINELVQSRPAAPRPNAWDPSPTTRYLALSMGFSILHYLLYATFVGIRRQSNPFVGRAGLRGSAWGEQRWEGQVESVRGDAEEVGELEEESEEETDSETEDEDELIDIPKPAELRARSSRMTLREGREEGGSRSRERGGSISPSERGLRVVSRFGSINSLAGI